MAIPLQRDLLPRLQVDHDSTLFAQSALVAKVGTLGNAQQGLVDISHLKSDISHFVGAKDLHLAPTLTQIGYRCAIRNLVFNPRKGLNGWVNRDVVETLPRHDCVARATVNADLHPYPLWCAHRHKMRILDGH